MNVSPPIDLDYLRQFSEGDTAFEQELLELFVADSQTHLAAVKAAIITQDLETVRQKAHQLKGSSSNVGANVMQDLAAQLEQAAKQETLEKVSTWFAELEAAYAAVATFVTHWKAGLDRLVP